MSVMTKSIKELKIRAKVLIKKASINQPQAYERLVKHHPRIEVDEDTLKLRHCQNVVARESGFNNWQHAQSILARSTEISHEERDFGLDMGTLWHNSQCGSFINLWFTHYSEEKAAASQKENGYLIPYKQQFIVVDKNYINGLGLLDGFDELWMTLNCYLFSSYPSIAWDEMAFSMIRNRC